MADEATVSIETVVCIVAKIPTLSPRQARFLPRLQTLPRHLPRLPHM